MGLRNLFRGKSEQEPDTINENQIIKNNQSDSENRSSTSYDESVTKSENNVGNNPIASSALTAKKNLEDIVRQYNSRREDLQDLLFDKQKEIQTSFDYLKEQVSDAQKLVDDTGNQITQIQNEMEQASQEVSAPLVEKQSGLNQQIEDNKSKAGNLVTQFHELNQELSDLNKRQQQLIQAEKDISSKFESETDPAVIVTLADQYRDDIESNKEERDRNASTIQAVDKKSQDVKDQLQVVRSQLTADQKQLQDLTDQLEQVQLKVATDDEGRSKQLDELTQELTSNQDELSQLQSDLDNKSAELVAANQDISNWLGVSVPIKQLELYEDSEIVLDVDGLTGEQITQLAAAVRVLTSHGIRHFSLFTSQFTLNLDREIAKWVTKLQVKGGFVSVYNPLYSLQNQGKPGAKYQLPDNAVSDEWNDARTERTMVLDNGWTLKVHYFEGSDAVANVDSYTGEHLAESSTLSTEGQLIANRFFNDDGTKNRDEYYSQSGLGILNLRYEQDELSKVELLNAVGMQVQTFDTIADFTEWWMKNSFDQHGLLMGAIENEQYRHLLGETKGEPITLVTGSSLEHDDFKAWAMALPKQQYLADNYQTEMKLIQRLNQPLTISLLDRRNLPVSLGVPAGGEE